MPTFTSFSPVFELTSDSRFRKPLVLVVSDRPLSSRFLSKAKIPNLFLRPPGLYTTNSHDLAPTPASDCSTSGQGMLILCE